MSDLDTFLTRDLSTLTPSDIDAIIAAQRAYRARLAAGEKPRKPKSSALTEDVTDLMNKSIAKAAPVIGTFRRF